MKKFGQIWRNAALLQLLATAGAGCFPRAETDMGRLVLAHGASSELFGWSADDTTLYWMGRDAADRYGLQAVDVQTGTQHPVLDGHDYAHSLSVSAADRLLFFIGDSSDWYSAGVLYQAPLVDHRAGVAVAVATNISKYSVSIDGVRLAVVDATTSEMSTIDLASGARCSFGKALPGSFSPDGTRLVYSTTSTSGTTTAYLADPLTGASEPFDYQGTIIAWDGGTPRQVLQLRPKQVVDVATGQTHPLPGDIPMLGVYSGNPADLTMGYYRWGDCLYETVGDDGVTGCGESQGLLYRVDLKDGQKDVIAKYNGRGWDFFAVSQNGKRLAVSYSLHDYPDLSLFVKELAPP
jgi:hypothetical protein